MTDINRRLAAALIACYDRMRESGRPGSRLLFDAVNDAYSYAWHFPLRVAEDALTTVRR